MQYREYGKTGKMVSIVGMGGMRFRSKDYEQGDLGKCAAIVHRAFERGINYFDTAPGYCDDKSEAILEKLSVPCQEIGSMSLPKSPCGMGRPVRMPGGCWNNP